MSGDREQSYYEIALTNRQVVVSFVCLLGSLVVVFFAGVWVGRVGTEPVVVAIPPGSELAAATPAPTPPLSPATPLPDLGRAAVAADPSTTLAEDVGRRVPPSPTPASTPAPTPTPLPTPTPTPTPVPTPTPTPVPVVAAATPAPTASPHPLADPQVVQVFSSPDASQARKVLAQLQDNGFDAFLSPIEVSSGTMYRVRIGPFEERADAEEVARRVRARLRLETWVTSAAN